MNLDTIETSCLGTYDSLAILFDNAGNLRPLKSPMWGGLYPADRCRYDA